jgi:hypothetical protein
VPYAVHDAGDAIVATGTVNGPAITLDTGSYAVVVQGNPPRRIEDVAVTIEEETSVAVPEN